MKWSTIWRPGRDGSDSAATHLPDGLVLPTPPAAPTPPAGPSCDDGPTPDDAPGPDDDRTLGHGLTPGRRASGRRAAAGRTGPGGVPTAGLPLLAVCDPRVPAELRALRTRIPGVDAALVGTLDGVVLAHDPTGGDVQAAGLVAAGLLAEGRQSTVTLGRGRFRNAVLWGADGFLAVYACGPDALLLILADPDTNVGSLHVEARASSSVIASLLAGTG